MIVDVYDRERTQFVAQMFPTLERVLYEISRMFPVWKRFVRFGQKLPGLTDVNTPRVPRESLAFTWDCKALTLPIVEHGVFRDGGAWGIVLVNWNDAAAPLRPGHPLFRERSAPFSARFDPERYGVPSDGTYGLFHYNKATGREDEVAILGGPIAVTANVSELSGELFVARPR